MPTRCAYCTSPIQDHETYVEVRSSHLGEEAPTKAHLHCAPRAARNFRETTPLTDRPATDAPKTPGKELRG